MVSVAVLASLAAAAVLVGSVDATDSLVVEGAGVVSLVDPVLGEVDVLDVLDVLDVAVDDVDVAVGSDVG